MLCRTVYPQKVVVKLNEYKPGEYLKELTNRSLEDSNSNLSSVARQKLPSVR